MATPGPTHIDRGARLAEVIRHAYQAPISLQSNLARSHAFELATAASMGYLTTRVHPRSRNYGFLWRPTVDGLNYLEQLTHEQD